MSLSWTVLYVHLYKDKMRIGLINCPNTARILKGLTALGTVLILVCFFNVAMEIFQHRDAMDSKSRYKQELLAKLKQMKNFDKVSYNKSICMEFIGRLGNQMFQFASAYGIAKAKNMKMRINVKDQVARVFHLSVTQVSNKYHCAHAKAKIERFHCAYDKNLLNFKPNKDIKLLTYLQSWKYFMNVSEELHKEFTFRKPIYDTAKTVFNKAIKGTKYFGQNGTYVGLHIRRGDMVMAQRRGKKFGYTVAPRSYIIRAMNYFLVKQHKVTFIICSDDIPWAKKEIGKYTNLLKLVFIDKNEPEVDLAVLSLCNHTIITTGTFSWWAGWLADGTVVYYKHPIMEGSNLRRQFSDDFTDYFLPSWIPMD